MRACVASPAEVDVLFAVPLHTFAAAPACAASLAFAVRALPLSCAPRAACAVGVETEFRVWGLTALICMRLAALALDRAVPAIDAHFDAIRRLADAEERRDALAARFAHSLALKTLKTLLRDRCGTGRGVGVRAHFVTAKWPVAGPRARPSARASSS